MPAFATVADPEAVERRLAALLGALTDPSPKLVRKALVLLTDLLLESSQAEAEGAKGAEASPTATGDAGVPLSHEAWNEGRASMEVGWLLGRGAASTLSLSLAFTRPLTRTRP